MSRHRGVESTLRGFTSAVSRAIVSEDIARSSGFLQLFDPRARLIGILLLVVAVAVSRQLSVIAVLFAVATALALVSRVHVRTLILRVWIIVFGFTGLIVLPAIFSTPGNVIARIGILTVTAQGLQTAALLIFRVETAATLTTTLVLCTPWNHILKALRSLGVPAEVIAMLAMTHRYIFLFIETARQMLEARESRILGTLPAAEQRRMTSRTAGVLMSKSIELSGEVFLAMQSRGFRGEVHLLDEFRLRFRDALALAVSFSLAFVAIWMGR